ncbi:ATP-binding protein [Kitasatospora sp. MBT66]|uniref:ATP-binding protein n=1 Tax=Kitasatospora sp. MBT66 TaxID=1444769 RepID=UPI00068D64FE|nr:ATP-binding protein [Kitasatospora sp. MBT66]
MPVAPVEGLGEYRLVIPAVRPELMGCVREIMRAQLRMWRKSQFSDVAELGVTELLTNVLRHAPGGSELLVSETVDGIRVGVTDFDERLPVAGRPMREATGGWGLQLLTDLVDEVGTRVLPQGKEVWFDLRAKGGLAGADE